MAKTPAGYPSYLAERGLVPQTKYDPTGKIGIGKHEDPRMDRLRARNVSNLIASATPKEREMGENWYEAGHEHVRKVASSIESPRSQRFGDAIRNVAAATANLSAQRDWDKNKVDVEQLSTMTHKEYQHLKSGMGLKGPQAAEHRGEVLSDPRFSTLREHPTDRIVTAFEHMHGIKDSREFLGEPRNHKTTTFGRTLENPSRSDEVTSDVHAHDSALGVKLPYNYERGLFSNENRYKRVSDDYRNAGKYLGMSPVHAQATAWTVWRNMDHPFGGAARPPDQGGRMWVPNQIRERAEKPYR